jgi:hypothetical protein
MKQSAKRQAKEAKQSKGKMMKLWPKTSSKEKKGSSSKQAKKKQSKASQKERVFGSFQK